MEFQKINHLLEKTFKIYPKDFIVKEVLNIKKSKKGKYKVFLLEKQNVSTLEAIELISKVLKIPKNKIGYAGLKDKFALTYQFISFPSKYKVENIILTKYKNSWKISKFIKPYYVKLSFYTFTNKPILLGKLKGNEFTITLRNLSPALKSTIRKNIKLRQIIPFPNYYGEQRFGTIKGRKDFMFYYLLKKDFEKALKAYYLGSANLENITWQDILSLQQEKLEEYEKELLYKLIKGYDIEKALEELPKRIKLLWAFSLQSLIWNEVLRNFVEENLRFVKVDFFDPYILSFNLNFKEEYKHLEIPFLGYKYIPQDNIKNIIKKVLKNFNISETDFEKEVIGIKFLEDNVRKAFVYPQDIKILEDKNDILKIKFFLPKGSYASIFIRSLYIEI